MIPFSAPYRAGHEMDYVAQVLGGNHWKGDGPFTAACNAWLTDFTGAHHVLQTPSCTHALELAAILLELGPGDEAIVPSFTFSSTAAAIAIRGATPVFVDCLPRTMNIDPAAVEAAITERTKAIFVMHYAGVSCDMSTLLALAEQHGLVVVEDNAHGLGAYAAGQHLGTFGALATQSWHDTKNVTSGEGGALLINDDRFAERAEIVREKGTNRARFLRGQVDKYTWVDQGSSYLPSELQSALLLAQLEAFGEIQGLRQRAWRRYADDLGGWAAEQGVELMSELLPADVEQPAHMFYLMMPRHEDQSALIAHLRERGITATFHYLPLDISPAGQRFGFTPYPCPVTADRSMRLVRLPLFAGLDPEDLDRIVDGVTSYRPGR